MRRIVLALALVLVNVVPAAGHGGGDPAYRSVVNRVTPAAGFTVAVLDRDDRLQLTRTGDSEVIVYGYEKEPYLRFSANGVFRNDRSPATYLNDERLGNVTVPAKADATAAPEWKKVAVGASYEWHDHRIHWMGTVRPPSLDPDNDQTQKVFDWSVPIAVGGGPGAISGELDYRPQAGNPWPAVLLGGVVLLLVGGAAVSLLLHRLRSDRSVVVQSS